VNESLRDDCDFATSWNADDHFMEGADWFMYPKYLRNMIISTSADTSDF
jgi:hypothetical protein